MLYTKIICIVEIALLQLRRQSGGSSPTAQHNCTAAVILRRLPFPSFQRSLSPKYYCFPLLYPKNILLDLLYLYHILLSNKNVKFLYNATFFTFFVTKGHLSRLSRFKIQKANFFLKLLKSPSISFNLLRFPNLPKYQPLR